MSDMRGDYPLPPSSKADEEEKTTSSKGTIRGQLLNASVQEESPGADNQ